MEGVRSRLGTYCLELLTPEIAIRRASSSAEITSEALKSMIRLEPSETRRSDEQKKTAKWFFEVIEEMSNLERQLLCKFWSGRNRLIIG
jgi:hypothetical protein